MLKLEVEEGVTMVVNAIMALCLAKQWNRLKVMRVRTVETLYEKQQTPQTLATRKKKFPSRN